MSQGSLPAGHYTAAINFPQGGSVQFKQAKSRRQALRQRRLAVLVAAAATAGGVVADSEQLMSTVEVSSQRLLPLPSVDAPAASTLAHSRASTADTASLLRDLPGVNLQGAGGTSSLPVLQGLADDRNRIKLDGMDLIASCPNHMNPPLSYIDPTRVGDIKVYAGISPVSLGGDSIGGTIVVQSRGPRFAAPGDILSTGELGAMYRSNGDAYRVNLGATLASERFSASYEGSQSASNNYRAAGDFKATMATGRTGHTLALDEVGSTAYKNSNHALGLAWRGDADLVEFKWQHQEVPLQAFPSQRMDMTDNRQDAYSLRHLGQYAWGMLESRVYHERVSHAMNFGPDKQLVYGTATNGMPMYSAGTTSGIASTATVMLAGDDVLRLGGEAQQYRLDDWWPASGTGNMAPNTFWNIRDGKRDRLAAFAEWEGRLAPRWMSVLGGRLERVASDAGSVQGYDNVDLKGATQTNQLTDSTAFNARNRKKTDINLDVTALARYTRDANLDIEFGAAYKTRSPNLYERYTWSTWGMAAGMNNTAGDGNGYVGNVDLKPEKAAKLSATVDLHSADRRTELKLTPYYTHVDDYIDAVRCGVNGTTCSAANATTGNQFVILQLANQSARLYGLDVSGKLPLGRAAGSEFGLAGLLNYTNGRNRDTGDGLYNVMPLNAKLVLTQRAGGWDNALELQGVQGKRDVSDVRNEIRTGGYSLTHLRASYSFDKVRIDFGVENLFDRFYRQPLGGAYLGQGMTMSLTGMTWGNALPGMGRSYYAGVNIKF